MDPIAHANPSLEVMTSAEFARQASPLDCALDIAEAMAAAVLVVETPQLILRVAPCFAEACLGPATLPILHAVEGVIVAAACRQLPHPNLSCFSWMSRVRCWCCCFRPD